MSFHRFHSKRDPRKGTTLLETLIALTIIALFALPFASALLNNSEVNTQSIAHLQATEMAFSILEEVALTRDFKEGSVLESDRFLVTTQIVPTKIEVDEETQMFIAFFHYRVMVEDERVPGAKAELTQLFGRRR